MLSVLLSVVAFIIIFSLLILVHEAGHFFSALMSGVKVREFGLGMPPKAFRLFKWRGADFTLNWIPFGGFVRMKGQDDFDNHKASKENTDPDSFEMATLPRRIVIVCAGVIMNAILAFILIFFAFKTSFTPLAVLPDSKVDFDSYIVMRESFARSEGLLVRSPDAPSQGIRVSQVQEDSKATKLGIKAGDIVLKVNNTEIYTTSGFFDEISKTTNLDLEIWTNKTRKNVLVERSTNQDKIGLYLETPETLQPKTYTFTQSLQNAGSEVLVQAKVTLFLFLQMVKGLVTEGELSKDVAGPIGIAQLTYGFTQQGVVALMLFTAMLSMSLAVINILPFPALDGGRLLFMLIEGIFRKKVSFVIEGYIHTIGFVLLMALILAVTWNDLMRLFN